MTRSGNTSHRYQPTRWLLLGHWTNMAHGSSLSSVPCDFAGYTDWPNSTGNVAHRLQHGHSWRPSPLASILPLMVPWTIDINTDHGPRHSPDDTMPPVAAQPLDTNMTTGSGLNPGHLCGFWWHHRPWTSQTLTVIGPWTQTLFQVKAQVWMSPWHPDWHGTCDNVALWLPYGSRFTPRPLASAWFLVVSEATNINLDPSWTLIVVRSQT